MRSFFGLALVFSVLFSSPARASCGGVVLFGIKTDPIWMSLLEKIPLDPVERARVESVIDLVADAQIRRRHFESPLGLTGAYIDEQIKWLRTQQAFWLDAWPNLTNYLATNLQVQVETLDRRERPSQSPSVLRLRRGILRFALLHTGERLGLTPVDLLAEVDLPPAGWTHAKLADRVATLKREAEPRETVLRALLASLHATLVPPFTLGQLLRQQFLTATILENVYALYALDSESPPPLAEGLTFALAEIQGRSVLPALEDWLRAVDERFVRSGSIPLPHFAPWGPNERRALAFLAVEPLALGVSGTHSRSHLMNPGEAYLRNLLALGALRSSAQNAP